MMAMRAKHHIMVDIQQDNNDFKIKNTVINFSSKMINFSRLESCAISRAKDDRVFSEQEEDRIRWYNYFRVLTY